MATVFRQCRWLGMSFFIFFPIVLLAKIERPTPTDIVINPAADYAPIVKAIHQAKKSIRVQNFNLTHPDIIQALIKKQNAKKKVDVQVILDRNVIARAKGKTAVDEFKEGGVAVKLGSAGFTISHSKMMVIDGKKSFVSTINLTRHPETTRGIGLFFEDRKLAQSLEKIFDADWKNADSGDKYTPTIPDYVVVSPLDARAKIAQFIHSAKHRLQLEVENFVDPDIADALKAASKRGVDVEVVVPRCSFTAPDLNMSVAKDLDAAGVDVRLMPEPISANQPYIHAKYLIADDRHAFVGSVNMSRNSLDQAREIGVLTDLGAFADDLQAAFKADHSIGLDYKNASQVNCGPRPFDLDELILQ